MVVDAKWWDIYDTEVVSEAKSVTALLGLIPSEATIPQDTVKSEAHSLSLVSLVPL